MLWNGEGVEESTYFGVEIAVKVWVRQPEYGAPEMSSGDKRGARLRLFAWS